MKKLLGIVVLGLLWFSTAYAECKGNCVNGTGTMEWPNGDKYVGEWKDGKIHGVGTLTWANGIKYVGDWKNGIEDGKGTVTWPDGTKYVGERYNAKAEGQGTFIWPNGDMYFGEWKNDRMHGIGKMTYSHGHSFKARWENNVAVELIGKDHTAKVKVLWNETAKAAVHKKFIFDSSDVLPKFIKKKDPTTFKELKFLKITENKSINYFTGLPKYGCENCVVNKKISFDVYIFKAIYEEDYGYGGIKFMVNTDFKSFEKAEKVALKYARYMGQLPAFLRESGFQNIYIHPQNKRWFADPSKKTFTIYSRSDWFDHYAILVHEAAHVATDGLLINDPLWKKAFDTDGKHITKYARKNRWEDAAETVLFWIALRCVDKVSNRIKKRTLKGIPNRIKHLDSLNFNTHPLECKK